jgi:hypothetical protein
MLAYSFGGFSPQLGKTIAFWLIIAMQHILVCKN